jgi:hypothetical protein
MSFIAKLNKVNQSSLSNLTLEKLTIKHRNEKYHFQKFTAIDEYLLIKDDGVDVFVTDFNTNTTEFKFEIKIGEELKDLIAIDLNNIFLFSSNKCFKYDIALKKLSHVNFYKTVHDEKISLEDISSIYFNNKTKLNSSLSNFYFGFIASDGILYLSSNVHEDKDAATFNISCEEISNFRNEIKHIEYKIFYNKKDNSLNGENNNGYCMITVLTQTNGYYTLVNILNTNDFSSFLDNVKLANWIEFYNFDHLEEEISKIFYSYHYDTNLGSPISFIVLTDTLQMIYCEFSTKYDKPEKLISSKYKIDFHQEITKNGFAGKGFKIAELIGIHHYDKSAYIGFKNKIFQYDLFQKELQSKKLETEAILDIGVYDPSLPFDRKPFYYLYFLSNRNVYFARIDTNYQIDKYRSNAANFHINNESNPEDFSGSFYFEEKKVNLLKINVIISVTIVKKLLQKDAQRVKQPTTVEKTIKKKIGRIIEKNALGKTISIQMTLICRIYVE